MHQESGNNGNKIILHTFVAVNSPINAETGNGSQISHRSDKSGIISHSVTPINVNV